MYQFLSLILVSLVSVLASESPAQITISPSNSDSTCPLVFTQYQRSFAALYASILKRSIQTPCHDCIKTKSRLAGLSSNILKENWSCWQIVFALAHGSDGCANECLYENINQCLFIRAPNSAVELTPLCSKCINAQESCNSQVSCQSLCQQNCATACTMPTECSPSSLPSNAQQRTLCQQCMSKFSNATVYDFSIKQQCLISSKNGGCRDVCVKNCGDGMLTPPIESCDDFNTVGGDGCSSECKIEAGFTCTGQPSKCSPKCGDGLKVGSEGCDDGNAANGDGCSSACTVEAGFMCNHNGTNGIASLCTPICGDGVRLGNEGCDDGNTKDGDGCSSKCYIEKGYVCTQNGTKSNCSTVCGDGVVAGLEQCDEGPGLNVDGTGCSSNCSLEIGFSCTSPNCTSVQSICGDGLRTVNEQCDVGKDINPGCINCTVQAHFTCAGAVLTKSVCTPICGDSFVVGVEACDDGNLVNGDGCSNTCQIETMTNSPLKWVCPTPGSPCQTVCSQPRIRKSWTQLTPAEQQLYLQAVQISMDQGLYAIFVGIHFEHDNDNQAHQTCAFITWHRRYLTAFENMLRSRGPQFACVTIPYWNYFSDYAKFITGGCGSGSMLECSPILNAFGGNRGPQRSISIPGMGNFRGNCPSVAPVNHVCPVYANSVGTGECPYCIPRGDWGASFPAGLGYASVASILASSNYQELNLAVQSGFHNDVHNALGGMMVSMASPSDPIFFSHHCTIDMMYQLYYKCAIGRKMSVREKQQDPRAYQGCVGDGAEPGTPLPTSTSPIQQTVYIDGRLVPAEKHPRVGQFFQNVGTRHYEFVDASDMGIHSYSYDVDALLHSLVDSGLVCANPNYIFAEESGIRSPSAVDKERFLLDESQPEMLYKKTYFKWFNKTRYGVSSSLENRYSNNYREKMRYVAQQVKHIECMHYERNYGCKDYTDLFKQSFGISYSSSCKGIVDDIRAGKKNICYSNWQKDCSMLRNHVPYS